MKRSLQIFSADTLFFMYLWKVDGGGGVQGM